MNQKNSFTQGNPAEILLIEDNPGDVLLTTKALGEMKIPHRLTVAGDGEQGLAMLRREAPYGKTPVPDIVLLDINLPKLDGMELLGLIRKDPEFVAVPIILLTSSRSEHDVFKSYNLQAVNYIVKPASLNQYEALVEAVEKCLTDIEEAKMA